MVLSSQTTMGMARHHDQTDVAACWGNLAGAAATGAGGCNSLLLPNPVWRRLGDTETGHGATRATLPFRKSSWGGSEGSNQVPTGGRQHGREVMSSNGVMLGDDRHAKGAVALEGASSQGRRIAQASNGSQYGCCGVVGFIKGKVNGVSGQNRMDTFGPSRDVDNMQAGKPRVRNICAAKGSGKGNWTDCTAKFAWMLTGLHHCECSQKIWITWEVACYTSGPLFQGRRQAAGAAVTRFKQVERKLFHKPCVLAEKSGRKLPSVEGRSVGSTGFHLRGLRHATPSTKARWVGPQNVSIFCRLAPVKNVVKNAAIWVTSVRSSRRFFAVFFLPPDSPATSQQGPYKLGHWWAFRPVICGMNSGWTRPSLLRGCRRMCVAGFCLHVRKIDSLVRSHLIEHSEACALPIS